VESGILKPNEKPDYATWFSLDANGGMLIYSRGMPSLPSHDWPYIPDEPKWQWEAHRRTLPIWLGMRRRCFNPDDPNYHNYGARGVTVCEDWVMSYRAFIRDMGFRPEGLSIDRINPFGNYEPANCRWITRSANSRNRRKSFKPNQI